MPTRVAGEQRGRPEDREIGLRRRGLAALTLLATAAVLVFVAVMVLSNPLLLLASFAGLAGVGTGTWWWLTEDGARHRVGAVIAVLGLAVVVTNALVDVRHRFWLLVGALGAGVVAVLAGRAALLVDRRPSGYRRVTPPQRPVVLCNPLSGGGKVGQYDLLDSARHMGVRTVTLSPGDDLRALARAAVADGADCLAMAGGDGSQAVVAAVAREHDVPFVCIPAGTRNHFAQDLGLPREDPRPALAALADGLERRVDLGEVDGRPFVNNVSFGVYARVVNEDGYREAKVGTARELAGDLLGATARPFDLRFRTPGGAEVDGAFLVLVSNNPYRLGATPDAAQRRAMDTGTLGVVAVTGETGRDAATTMALGAFGRRITAPGWHEFTTESLRIDSADEEVLAGVDGEAVHLRPPVVLRSHPGALRVLVPSDNPAAVARRGARDARVSHLLDLVRGRAPSPPQSV